MPDSKDTLLQEGKVELTPDLLDDPVGLVEKIYKLWINWADFHLFILSPTLPTISPPLVIPPEMLDGEILEYVYTIYDYGNQLSTSKSENMFSAGMSMCKLFFTIEKMIFLLIERLKSGGITETEEVQVAIGGHEWAKRKGFESIINLSYNVVVTNFDPGLWGERYLQSVKRIAEKGYGYPSNTPRTVYRNTSSTPGRRK